MSRNAREHAPKHNFTVLLNKSSADDLIRNGYCTLGSRVFLRPAEIQPNFYDLLRSSASCSIHHPFPTSLCWGYFCLVLCWCWCSFICSFVYYYQLLFIRVLLSIVVHWCVIVNCQLLFTSFLHHFDIILTYYLFILIVTCCVVISCLHIDEQ